MKKDIQIEQNVYEIIEQYVRRYRIYYQELFEDSGVWNRAEIIAWYEKESIIRYSEILDMIEEKISNSVITYIDNTAIIRWRSKILLVSFRDEWNIRIITHLEIR